MKIDARQPNTFDRTIHGKVEIDGPCAASTIRRLDILEQPTTNAYRILTGDAEGIFGINVERYGKVLVVQVLDGRKVDEETVLAVAKWYQRTLGVSSVYVKTFVRNRTGAKEAAQDGLRDSTPLIGPAVEPEITVHEYGLLFAIRPYDGYSVGLFPDHRENRQRVRAQSKGKDVLNLFCYTGSFSVVAAAGGATSVTSVDVAKKNLEWSRRTFSLNGQDAAAHSFVCEDARAYLARAKRRGTTFDMIILDPPTFAHGKGKRGSFSVADDLAEMTAAAIETLRPDGVMMISSNYRKFSLKDLRAKVRQAAGSRRVSVTETPPLPVDYAVDANHAKTIFVRVK